MAKKKAELEHDVLAYNAQLARAETALRERRFDDALTEAAAAWDFVDGMMQYKNKYEEKQFNSIRCVDIVTIYAPMLFRNDVLERLEVLLKSQRRVEKNTAADLGHALATARRRLVDAHRLWNLLAQPAIAEIAELAERLGGDQAEWDRIASLCCQIGVFRYASHNEGASILCLATDLKSPCTAKCLKCGNFAVAPKEQLLGLRRCEVCNVESVYCLTA